MIALRGKSTLVEWTRVVLSGRVRHDKVDKSGEGPEI